MKNIYTVIPLALLTVFVLSSCTFDLEKTPVVTESEPQSTPVVQNTTASGSKLRAVAGKEVITESGAIAQCKSDMEQPVFSQCRDENDIAEIKAFMEILRQKWDNSQKISDMLAGQGGTKGSNGASYLGRHSYVLIKTKYFEGGYLFFLRSPQYDGVNNVILEYRKITSDGAGVSVFYDDLSSWETYAGEATPEGYYETISKEFEKGEVFSMPKIQEFYDNFIGNIRKG